MSKKNKEVKMSPEQMFEFKAQETRCVKTAREIFKLLGENADSLPMGDELSPEDFQKAMVPIVDKIGEIMINNGLKAKSDFKLVTQYMMMPISDYEWRVHEFIEGFKKALVEATVGVAYDDMTVSQLKDTISKTFPQKKVE